MQYLWGVILIIACWAFMVICAKVIDKSNSKKEWYLELKRKIESEQ